MSRLGHRYSDLKTGYSCGLAPTKSSCDKRDVNQHQVNDTNQDAVTSMICGDKQAYLVCEEVLAGDGKVGLRLLSRLEAIAMV